MKLWQKASCVCAAVLAGAVLVCSGILLLYARGRVLDMAGTQVEDRQRDLAASFYAMTGYYVRPGDSASTLDALVKYCFAQFADSSSVLMTADGQVVWSAQSIDPSAYLPYSRQWEEPSAGMDRFGLYEGRVGDRDMLMVGSAVGLAERSYLVYQLRDVTEVHQSIAAMARTFALVSAAGIALGVGLTTLLIRRGARPLAALSGAARRIAGGEYAIRAQVDTADEIGDLAADFNAMADAVQARVAALEETAERQRLFIGGVTHEFKTPLTAVLLHADMLRSANMTAQERDASLVQIQDQCRWLERLVQTLLRLITPAGRIDLERVPTAELFDRVRQSTEPALTARGVALETDWDTDQLTVNMDLMRSLLVNLVDNAGKSYDPGTAGAVVYLSARGNVLQVLDRGRGIPPEAQERIFEPFYMVDKSRSKKAGGSGLGLALVRQIADAHGAVIEVDSAPGRGTAVRVKLQLNYNQMMDAAPPEGP